MFFRLISKIPCVGSFYSYYVLYIRVAWFSTFCDLQNWIHSCRSGIFLGVQFKKQALGKLCQIVIGPLFRNFTFKCCSFTWRRATKKFDFYHKMGNNKKLCFIHFYFLEPAPFLFDFLRSYNEENSNLFSFNQAKNQIAHFGAKK